MAAVTVTCEGCRGSHNGGFGQVRGITGITVLGPAADTAIMSSTEMAMAAAEIQPRNPERNAGAAGLAGRTTRGTAGGPAVVVTTPCPCPFATTPRDRVDAAVDPRAPKLLEEARSRSAQTAR